MRSIAIAENSFIAAPEAQLGTSVAVVGATGYAGAELTAILARHANATISCLFGGTSGGSTPISAIHPALATLRSGDVAQPFNLDALLASNPDVVFLATPNETSAGIVPHILDAGCRVIDLSGAFRLHDHSLYPSWYGFQHGSPELLSAATYGLTEWCRSELPNARLVANPGCYPTSILLALRPLTFLIDRDQPVICDSGSGASGAGKKSDLAWSFSELFGNVKVYGVGTHRHEPEIRQGLRLGDRATLVFVPHLLPIARGILSTMHIGFSRKVSEEEITHIYTDLYADAPFVTVLPAGQLPELKSVVNTPRAEIGFQLLQGGRRAVIVSAIDNLLKGAASQAIQNFNLMCGYAETEGLQ